MLNMVLTWAVFLTSFIYHIRGDSLQEIYMNINQDGHLRTGLNSPKCMTGSNIQLNAYNYQYRKCTKNQLCQSSSIISFSVKQEHLIHRLCSFRESCSDLSLLIATPEQKEKSNAVFLLYQCLDLNRNFNSICENKTTILKENSNLIYVNPKNIFKECRCFLKDGNFTVTLQDIRLQTDDDQNCSSAVLRIDSSITVCEDQNSPLASTFQTDMEGTLDRLFISVAKTSLADTVQMIWLNIRPIGSVSMACYRSTWEGLSSMKTVQPPTSTFSSTSHSGYGTMINVLRNAAPRYTNIFQEFTTGVLNNTDITTECTTKVWNTSDGTTLLNTKAPRYTDIFQEFTTGVWNTSDGTTLLNTKEHKQMAPVLVLIITVGVVIAAIMVFSVVFLTINRKKLSNCCRGQEYHRAGGETKVEESIQTRVQVERSAFRHITCKSSEKGTCKIDTDETNIKKIITDHHVAHDFNERLNDDENNYQEIKELIEMPRKAYRQIRPVPTYNECVYFEVKESQGDENTKICKAQSQARKLPALPKVDNTEWIADVDGLDCTSQMCPPNKHEVDDYLNPTTVGDKTSKQYKSDNRNLNHDEIYIFPSTTLDKRNRTKCKIMTL